MEKITLLSKPPHTTNTGGQHVHSPKPYWPNRRTHGHRTARSGLLRALSFLPKRRAVRSALHGPHGLITLPFGPVENTPRRGATPRNRGVRLVHRSAGGPGPNGAQRNAGAGREGRGHGGGRPHSGRRGKVASAYSGPEESVLSGTRLTASPAPREMGKERGRVQNCAPSPRGVTWGKGGGSAAAGIKGLKRNLDSSLLLYMTRWKGSRLSLPSSPPSFVSPNTRTSKLPTAGDGASAAGQDST